MQPNLYEIDFLNSLLLSLVSESLTLYLLLQTKYFKEFNKVKTQNILLVGILATVTTLPYLWFVVPAFVHNIVSYHIIGEFSVVFIESLIYFLFLKMDYKRLLIISFLCNAVSYLTGLLS